LNTEQAVNGKIRDRFIILIDETGKKRGKMMTKYALSMAEEKGMDLVEVSFSKEDKAKVCKIMDYGKIKYEQSKKSKSKSPVKAQKEIKIRPVTGANDLLNKNNHVKDFLKKGHEVKYTMDLRSKNKKRVVNSSIEQMIEELRQTIKDNFGDTVVTSDPSVSSREISFILKPVSRKSSVEADK